MKRKSGFTLIELMIVVAIIGILASIAIPNFLKFQAKAKQAEAKANLGSLFTAMIAYYAEYTTYPGDIGAVGLIGWEPQFGTKYGYYVGSDVLLPQDLGADVVACTVAVTTVTQEAFTLIACGNVDKDTTVDEWSFTDAKILTSVVNDVSD